ncbi:putative RNA methylase [Dyadobacter sp. BE34]|uniref:site-specific DNA-methyltransferase (adenine-specific) n=1 Tax=Dyadobacter fermentans TaxID=94254 RepID=A0ABU1QY81_9BACT|nr:MULTISPECIES: N-6 DNA methylase [Dyadobacter]MDR6805685.1 putative RNA methylase [Dyadobacter fermentans]MDR7042555.1 putative RNA methylase [Dyadobacter sp. BE242]MDR7196867.1 putative RNA methylase [Dyadobacter sp. BE34]MDR7215698.1 putative RNA methylase [Dyadobacter sp. BE31]MDR7263234.1 putative RNA methylase [Dyadobacter sp. BE32]
MASQTRTYARKKLLGQVYTPLHIVDKILGHCGFYETDLTEKRMLDPACGDGRFLVPMAEFIIRNTPADQIAGKLQQLHGWDIDQKALQQCRENLDALTAPLGIEVNWNLRKCDALKQWRSREKFDLIVGNPPYIRIQHLPQAQRKYIQKHYSFCSAGSTDAFIAFFQLAAKLLADNGICAMITPNSYLVSESGGPLRKYFYKKRNLRHITNYRTVPVFGAASTYPAITIFGGEPADHFRFEHCVNNRFEYEGRDIPHTELQIDIPWQLSVQALTAQEGRRLGDICKISVGLTTLADGCYLFQIISEKNGLVYAKNKNGFFTHLEKDVLKPIIKGSKLKSADDAVTEYILFPYQKDESDKQRIIPEETLKNDFPQTYSYLLKVKSELDRRDNGKPNAVAWYAFGRAQGLDNAFGKKIIFSPMNREPNFILYENPDVTVYSGYFIKYDGDYQTLLEQLNSQRMADFVAIAGRDFQGGYKGYNKKVIENFIVTNHS